MKKIISILLCAVCAFSLAGCGAAGGDSVHQIIVDPADYTEFTGPTIDAIKKEGVLKMATEAQYAPYEFIDTKGNFVGCDVWLGEQIAAALGVKLQITDMAFDGIVPAVKAGQADIGIACMTTDPERAKEIDFSAVYQQNVQLVVVPKGMEDAYADKTAFDGKTVGAQRGSIQAKVISSVLTGAELFELDKWPNLAMEVASGKIDAIVVDAAVGENMVANNDKLAIANFTFAKEDVDLGQACVLKKDDSADLLALVDAVIANVEGDKGFNAAYDSAVALSKEMGL